VKEVKPKAKKEVVEESHEAVDEVDAVNALSDDVHNIDINALQAKEPLEKKPKKKPVILTREQLDEIQKKIIVGVPKSRICKEYGLTLARLKTYTQ
jgi:hypothetical protein